MKPPKASYEEPYQADYRIGGALKRRIDDVAGGCLLLVHHSRKAESADFIDSVSGTQGIAGSADFVLVLARKRHCDDAVLSVTGRDVPENEYALTTRDGRWTLDGMDLMDAAAAVAKRRDSEHLGDRSVDAMAFVNGRPLGTRPGDLATHLGIGSNDAGTYLRRLHEAGRIGKRTRGIYTPLSYVSEVSESDLAGDAHQQNGRPADVDRRGGRRLARGGRGADRAASNVDDRHRRRISFAAGSRPCRSTYVEWLDEPVARDIPCGANDFGSMEWHHVGRGHGGMDRGIF